MTLIAEEDPPLIKFVVGGFFRDGSGGGDEDGDDVDDSDKLETGLSLEGNTTVAADGAVAVASGVIIDVAVAPLPLTFGNGTHTLDTVPVTAL